MAKLMPGQQIRFSFMQQMRRELCLKHVAKRPMCEHSTLRAEEIVLVEVVWDGSGPFLLTFNGGDHAITASGGNTMVRARLGKAMADSNPPVLVVILDQTAVASMSVRRAEM